MPLISWSNVRPLVVLGSSMEPSLLSGQVVLLDRDYYRHHPLEAGHVVAFVWQGKTYVKRIAAVAGESVNLLCQDGYCTPTSPELKERAQRLARKRPRFKFHTRHIDRGHFWCLGDYLSASVDSRELGAIPTSAVLGRVQSMWGSPLSDRPPTPTL
jgi:signal peptidase I